MKPMFLLILLLAAPLFVLAEDPSYSPVDAIQRFGSISISDGSSFFTFSKDGSFHSGPLGISGREFTGRWTADDSTFTVTAKLGWINGVSSTHDYRRIVFAIYHVRKHAPDTKPAFGVPVDLFDAYFLIEEMVNIPEPVTPSK